ncbi:MAG: hypothetical protein V4475_05575 [Pseudomonadota bacterium]
MAITMDERGGRRGNGWRIAGWGAAAALLLAPLVAMQFTREVNWTSSDFALMAAMLGGVGVGVELAVRKSSNLAYRAAFGVALAAAFFLIVINGAVGIIGSEREDANLLFGGVILIALIGAIAARFRPAGMALTMGVAALAQLLVPAIALFGGLAPRAMVLAPEVPIATAVFAGMWLVAGWLFRKAA